MINEAFKRYLSFIPGPPIIRIACVYAPPLKGIIARVRIHLFPATYLAPNFVSKIPSPYQLWVKSFLCVTKRVSE
jgi:hypothetical protein